jgi:hypothetical protein
LKIEGDMSRVSWIVGLSAAITLAVAGAAAHAATPAEVQKSLEAAARAEGTFTGFSAQRGEQFFNSKHGNDWSCASCHTQSPLQQGKHAQTGKAITPLAPAANPQRFTDIAKVEKWFKRNCNDVAGRACTAQEKGDVMQYLMSLK